jgi:hypothetical protein
MVPETEHPSTLQQMIAAGMVRPPAEHGMPELIPDLARTWRAWLTSSPTGIGNAIGR